MGSQWVLSLLLIISTVSVAIKEDNLPQLDQVIFIDDLVDDVIIPKSDVTDVLDESNDVTTENNDVMSQDYDVMTQNNDNDTITQNNDVMDQNYDVMIQDYDEMAQNYDVMTQNDDEMAQNYDVMTPTDDVMSQNHDVMTQNDDVMAQNNDEDPNLIEKANSTQASEKRILRLVVFSDDALLSHLGDLYPEDPPAATRSYITTGVAAMEDLLQQAVGEDVDLKIQLVQVGVWAKGATPFSTNGFSATNLISFCEWASSRRPEKSEKGHWHHAMFLTGKELFETTKDSLGVTFVGGMCHPRTSCSVVEAMSFKAVQVAAHELAHSMGVPHDGEGAAASCPDEGFLMGKSLAERTYQWSNCSKEAFKAFIKNDTCLDRREEDREEGDRAGLNHDQGGLPGQRYSADEQCELALGKGFKATASKWSLCENLMCTNGVVIRGAHPALPGTSCGSNRVCKAGKCEGSRPSRPNNPYRPPTNNPYNPYTPPNSPYWPPSNPYSPSRPPYGSNRPPYGSNRPPYGSNRPPYNSNRPPYKPYKPNRPHNPYRPPGNPNRPPYNPYRPPGNPNRPPQNPYRPPGNPNRPPQNPYRPPGNRPPQNPYRPPGNPNRPPQNPYRPPGNPNRPPQNPYRPPGNPNRPPQNPNRPPSNNGPGAPPASGPTPFVVAIPESEDGSQDRKFPAATIPKELANIPVPHRCNFMPPFLHRYIGCSGYSDRNPEPSDVDYDEAESQAALENVSGEEVSVVSSENQEAILTSENYDYDVQMSFTEEGIQGFVVMDDIQIYTPQPITAVPDDSQIYVIPSTFKPITAEEFDEMSEASEQVIVQNTSIEVTMLPATSQDTEELIVQNTPIEVPMLPAAPQVAEQVIVQNASTEVTMLPAASQVTESPAIPQQNNVLAAATVEDFSEEQVPTVTVDIVYPLIVSSSSIFQSPAAQHFVSQQFTSAEVTKEQSTSEWEAGQTVGGIEDAEQITTEETEEITTETVGGEESSTEPTLPQNITTESFTEETTSEIPVTGETTTLIPVTEGITTNLPSAEETTTEISTAEQTTISIPATEVTATDIPATEQTSTGIPTTEEMTKEPSINDITTESYPTEITTANSTAEESTSKVPVSNTFILPLKQPNIKENATEEATHTEEATEHSTTHQDIVEVTDNPHPSPEPTSTKENATEHTINTEEAAQHPTTHQPIVDVTEKPHPSLEPISTAEEETEEHTINTEEAAQHPTTHQTIVDKPHPSPKPISTAEEEAEEGNAIISLNDFNVAGSGLQFSVPSHILQSFLSPIMGSLAKGTAPLKGPERKLLKERNLLKKDLARQHEISSRISYLRQGHDPEILVAANAPSHTRAIRIGQCSRPCGGGIRVVSQVCVKVSSPEEEVPEELCDGLPSSFVPFNQSCNTFPCADPDWVVGPWSSCSHWCGLGVQRRLVTCGLPLLKGTPPLVAGRFLQTKECSGLQPTEIRLCKGACLKVDCALPENVFHEGCYHLLKDTPIERDDGGGK